MKILAKIPRKDLLIAIETRQSIDQWAESAQVAYGVGKTDIQLLTQEEYDIEKEQVVQKRDTVFRKNREIFNNVVQAEQKAASMRSVLGELVQLDVVDEDVANKRLAILDKQVVNIRKKFRVNS